MEINGKLLHTGRARLIWTRLIQGSTLFKSIFLLMDDFELIVPDLYFDISIK